MEIITLDSSAYKNLIEKIEAIYQAVINRKNEETEHSETDSKDPFIEFYSSKQVSEMLQMSMRTLQRLRGNREITYLRVGGRIRYRKGDITQYLQTHKVRTNAEITQGIN